MRNKISLARRYNTMDMLKKLTTLLGGVTVFILGFLLYTQTNVLTFRTDPTPSAISKVQIRWFVGLGTGTTLEQIAVEEAVVADFNASQENIELVLEVVTIGGAYDIFSTQIATGNFPDIIGPVRLGQAHQFYGHWLDLAPYIEESGFDTRVFSPNMISFYHTEEGQISLPFGVSTSAIYYVPALFDEVGLAYPPQVYGENYILDGKEVAWTWDTLTQVAKRLTLDRNGYNATQTEFDASQTAQVGFSTQRLNPVSLATYFGAATIYARDDQGKYISAIPNQWQAAWQWWYDAMWGTQPFMAPGWLASTDEFGNGNLFNAGKAAMLLADSTYTCCLPRFQEPGQEFQIGILPVAADGRVHGRITEISFRIWKNTPHPEEAVEVLMYLLSTGSEQLLPAYGVMPAISANPETFLPPQAGNYPFVSPQSWNVFVQGLAYPDIPSAEQYLPNWNEAYYRFQIFGDRLVNTHQLDFESEFELLQADLARIYNK